MLINDLACAADNLSYEGYYSESALIRDTINAITVLENDLAVAKEELVLLDNITALLDAIEADGKNIYTKEELLAPFYNLFGVAR